jgi:hypothetical protein
MDSTLFAWSLQIARLPSGLSMCGDAIALCITQYANGLIVETPKNDVTALNIGYFIDRSLTSIKTTIQILVSDPYHSKTGRHLTL